MKLEKNYLFDILLNDSLNAIILSNEKGEIFLVNKEAEKMFGYSAEELAGQSVNILIPVNARKDHSKYIKEYGNDPQSRIMGQGREVIAIHKSGKQFPVEVGLKPILIDNELLILSSVIDISIRKENEERIKALEQMRTRFFMNISHEFKTPLTLVSGPLEHLLSKIIDKDAQEDLKLIKKSVDELSALINQLLEQSDLYFGEKKLYVSQNNFVSFFNTLLCKSGLDAEENDFIVEYNKNLLGKDIYFSEEIFEKLLLMFFKIIIHTKLPKNKSHLSFKIEKNQLRFSTTYYTDVVDKEMIESILINGSYSLSKTGNPISRELSLVNELVLFHKGEMKLNYTQPEKLEISFYVPCDIKAYSQEEILVSEDKKESVFDFMDKTLLQSRKETDPDQIFPIDQEKKIVLIVEDNQGMQNYLTRRLRENYNIVSAYNGKEGFEKAVDLIPDLILSDVMMPLMDGIEFCSKIRNDLRTIHIPVILLTAKSEISDKITGLNVGADDFLNKPFDQTELNTRIANLIKNRETLRKQFKKMVVIKPEEITTNSMDEQFLKNIMENIEKNMENEKFGVDELSNNILLSPSQLYRKLMGLTGYAPSVFIQTVRLKKAAELIQKQSANIGEVSYKVGFGSPSYFSKCFKEHFGCTPREFMKNPNSNS